MFSTSELTASSYNMFDNMIDGDMVQIHQELITEKIIDASVEIPNIIGLAKPVLDFSMINKLLGMHFSNNKVYSTMTQDLLDMHYSHTISKRAVNKESVILFNSIRNEVRKLVNQESLCLFDEIIAFAVMPDAKPEHLENSVQHKTATFLDVLIAAQLIHHMGPIYYSRRAVWLILEWYDKLLTYEEIELATKNIIYIAIFSRDFQDIVEYIIDRYPEHKKIAHRIIREAFNKEKLSYKQLEWCLSMIQLHFNYDDQTIRHALAKRMGRLSQPIYITNA